MKILILNGSKAELKNDILKDHIEIQFKIDNV